MPTPTPLPTNTPVPVVKLVLDAGYAVLGYWSDGTADVEVTATLRNEGTLQLDGAGELTATCIAEGDERRACREELSLALQDGFAPASGSFTLRLPMGATTLTFDYGGDEPPNLDIDVPERILGVDREVWECYIDRPPEGWDWARDALLCGTMTSALGEYPVVEKWLSDVPVKVWATGEPDYIEHLASVLADISSVSGLGFEWVDAKEKADFVAYVGLSDSELLALSGFDSVDALHGWGGLASWGGRGRHGEIISGVIWTKPFDDESTARGVILHEALHALIPMHHSNRPLSMMGCCSVEKMSPMDIELIKLNYHSLIRPGMSMDDVRNLVVLTDELLDYPIAIEHNPMDIIWRMYRSLLEADSVSFRLSGGECDRTFGVRRGPIEMAIGDFDVFSANSALLYLNIHPHQFHVAYSPEDGEWTHWRLSPGGTWERVDYDTVAYASSYWLWNGKLRAAIRSVLMDGSPEDISIEETPGGSISLQVTLDHSYVNMWNWTGRDSLDLALVVDPETYALEGYTWELHNSPEVNPDECHTYKEVATDGHLGVDIAKLLDDPQVESNGTPDDPLGLVWRAYVALERADSASFRLSGGWMGGCNYSFGKRRGPISVVIGDFFGHRDPRWAFFDFHSVQAYTPYIAEDGNWSYFMRDTPTDSWAQVDRETVTGYSEYWHWDGKLSQALRSILIEASPEELVVNSVDGSLHIEITFDRSFSSYFELGEIDSHIDLVLVLDQQSLDLSGYTWTFYRNDDYEGCRLYTETATDFRLGIPEGTPVYLDFQ